MFEQEESSSVLSSSEQQRDPEQAAQAIRQAVRQDAFERYQRRKADNTVKRQKGDIALFEKFLEEKGISQYNLFTDPNVWRFVTVALVEHFVEWQVEQGYAIDSINIRLSTIRRYAALACQVGVLSSDELFRIREVKGFRRIEGRRIDAKREVTRVGMKKGEPTRISSAQVATIKQQLLEETMRGDTLASRDLLLFVLAAEHSLRCSELALLTRNSLNLEEGQLRIYRQKTDRRQVHQLTPSTLDAAQRYFQLCAVEIWLFPGEALGTALATRSIYDRISELGRRVGLEKLGPHDLRHYYATYSQGDISALQQAGGWSSSAMPLKYRVEQDIANTGVIVPGQPGWER